MKLQLEEIKPRDNQSLESFCKYLLNRVYSGLADHYSNTSLASSVFRLIFQSESVFMFIMDEAIQNFLSIWLEGFLYGKPELCALTCTLSKGVQLMIIILRFRTLFWNICPAFTMPLAIEKVRDDNPFLRCLSPIRFIYC